MHQISHNRLRIFLDCRLRYKLTYVLKCVSTDSTGLPRDKFYVGKWLHWLIERRLKNESMVPNTPHDPVGLACLVPVAFKMSEPYVNHEEKHVERTLTFEHDGYKWLARPDLILKEDDGYVVIDFKSGGLQKEKNYLQACVYVLGVNKCLGQCAKAVFVAPSQKNTHNITLKDAEITLSHVAQNMMSVKEDTYVEPTVTSDCVYCPMRGNCDAWLRSGLPGEILKLQRDTQELKDLMVSRYSDDGVYYDHCGTKWLIVNGKPVTQNEFFNLRLTNDGDLC